MAYNEKTFALMPASHLHANIVRISLCSDDWVPAHERVADFGMHPHQQISLLLLYCRMSPWIFVCSQSSGMLITASFNAVGCVTHVYARMQDIGNCWIWILIWVQYNCSNKSLMNWPAALVFGEANHILVGKTGQAIREVKISFAAASKNEGNSPKCMTFRWL